MADKLPKQVRAFVEDLRAVMKKHDTLICYDRDVGNMQLKFGGWWEGDDVFYSITRDFYIDEGQLALDKL